jgi:gamma-glutamylaminecyclotransferase
MDPRTDASPQVPEETLLFVYGTAMSGGANHGLLDGCRFLGATRTGPGYDLVDLGGFPALLEGGETPVSGELYALDPTVLRLFDEMEDHPEYFRRTPIRLEDGREVVSYVLPERQGRPYPRIVCGSWREAHARPRPA